MGAHEVIEAGIDDQTRRGRQRCGLVGFPVVRAPAAVRTPSCSPVETSSREKSGAVGSTYETVLRANGVPSAQVYSTTRSASRPARYSSTCRSPYSTRAPCRSVAVPE
jgi:hypothetical protein